MRSDRPGFRGLIRHGLRGTFLPSVKPRLPGILGLDEIEAELPNRPQKSSP